MAGSALVPIKIRRDEGAGVDVASAVVFVDEPAPLPVLQEEPLIEATTAAMDTLALPGEHMRIRHDSYR
jgi:hypothetical protein